MEEFNDIKNWKRLLILVTLSSFFPNESPSASFGTMKQVMPLYPLEIETDQDQKLMMQ